MSNFDSQRKEREYKRGIKRSNNETIAKYFLDLSKVLLTAIALATLAPLATNPNADINILMFSAGLLSGVLSFLLGYIILRKI